MNKITEIQIIPIKPKDGLIGFASFVYNKDIYFSSIGIHRKLNGSGYRITYPDKQVGNRQISLHHPINRTISAEIEQTILQKAEEIFD